MDKTDINILFVDDQEPIRELFTATLPHWGYAVDTAVDGIDALEKFDHKSYHIVITDLNMPRMDGMALLKRIKSRWPGTEVIIVTGYGTVESAIEGMKNGAADFILKPVKFNQVHEAVDRSFQRVRHHLENEELRRSNQQLLDLNDLKDKFLSLTNHEMRTPLTIICGYLDILKDEVSDGYPEIKDIIQVLQRSAEELNETVDRMHLLKKLPRRDFSRIDTDVDISVIGEAVVKEFLPLFAFRHITLHYTRVPSPVMLPVLTQDVKMMIRELLQNALKFTPDGGEVNLRITMEDDEAVIEVADTGIGIPYDKHELIFSEFYEVQDSFHHRSSRRSFMGGGVGIGLSMVKECVTSLSGEIQLTSEPERGSTFRLTIPASAPRTADKTSTTAVSEVTQAS